MSLPDHLKESGEVLDLLIGLGNAAGKAALDGKISYLDAALFIDPLMSLMPAIDGADKALKELMMASDMDKALLADYFAEKFDLPQDGIEKRIEEAITFGFSLFSYIQTWKKK